MGSDGGFRAASLLAQSLQVLLVLCIVAQTIALAVSADSTAAFAEDDMHFASLFSGRQNEQLSTRSGRALLQQNDIVPTSNGSLILAAARTDRPDPLNGFYRYHGGWDIRNQSYWASVGFTGLPGFLLALLWFALGLFALLMLSCFFCCCPNHIKREHDHGPLGFYIPLLLLLLFTALAIGGCYALFSGQQKFHKELSSTLDDVVSQANTTVQGLHNVSAYLSQASTIDVESYGVPSDTKQNIQQLNMKIGQAADSLQNRTHSNAANIRKTINRIQLALIIVSGVMLLLVLLGLLFAACGVRPIVYFLVVVGWVLVVGTWILCGVFILLNNAIGDTCVAMQEWVAHPYAKTTLDAILPCVDPQTGANTLLQSKAIVSTIASNVDLAITIVANNNNQLAGPPLFYNQSGPAVPTICNPYGAAPNYADQACPAGSLTFATAPQAWSHFICPSINGICSGPGRLTQDLYNQLAAASNVSYGLEQYSPFLVDLEDCQTVRNTFTAIQTQHCHRMRKDTKWVWVGLAIISVGSMLSILLWMLYIRRRNMRYKRARYGKGSYA
jgi:hypothetical protein